MERKFGPYTLIQQIAVGGMAEIHLARTEGIAGFEKYVAIKMIHPNFSEDQQFIQMLIDEAKITVQLAHVNIAQTFDLGRVGDTYYITMEFVEGCDLYRLLREGSELDMDVPIDVASYVVKEAITGLDYAHRKRDVMGSPLRIIHRDVSPQNVLVSKVGEVKVIDFGIAKANLRAQETQAGVIKGKYYYMSPEQAWGEHLDPRTDVFSAGIILYELLTGQMLYLEEDLQVLLERVREADIAPPTTLRRDIPAELEHIVMRALQKRPNDRFSTGAEMADALGRFLRSHSPVCGANSVADWALAVLGDPTSEPPKPSMDERDMRAITQGFASEQLLHTEDDFSDENSIIFHASEVHERMQTAEEENDLDDERDANQETGLAEPGDMPTSGYIDRDASDDTRALDSRPPTLDDNSPLEELYPDNDGEERTMISGPPGFGMGSPLPPPPPPARPKTRPSPVSRRIAVDDFDAEETLAQDGRGRASLTNKAQPPETDAPASESTKTSQTQADVLDELTGDNEPTMTQSRGPWRQSNALNVDNPKPAVSALKPARKSRRTPPRGVPTQGQAGPNSVLSNLITGSGDRAQVALSPARGSDMPIPPGRPPAKSQQQPTQQPYAQQQQPYAQQQQQPYAQQQPYTQRQQQPYGMPAPYAQQLQSGFPARNLATDARMAAYEIDELPDAYRLTNHAVKAKWLIPVIGFLVLAVGAGAATYFLLTQKEVTSSPVATLMVVSSPAGAKVSINGSLLTSTTPTSYSNANVGDTLRIVIDLKGHRQWESETTIKTPNDKIVARLDPMLVNLLITSEPVGAEIYLNGNASPAGRTPKTFSDIDPATATSILLKKDGFREVKRSVDWTKDTKKQEHFVLEP